MSQKKTIAGKLIEWVIDLFKRNWASFVNKNYDKIPEDIKEKISIIIQVVNKVNEFAQSPIADVITNVIPGNVDDQFKEWLRKVLPIVLAKAGDVRIGSQRAAITAELTKELTGMRLAQSMATSQFVYEKEFGLLA